MAVTPNSLENLDLLMNFFSVEEIYSGFQDSNDQLMLQTPARSLAGDSADFFGTFKTSPFKLENGAPELFILFAVQIFFAFNVLNKLNGDPKRVANFFFYIPVDLPQLRQPMSVTILSIVTILSLFAPVVTLVVFSFIFSRQAVDAGAATEYPNIYFFHIFLPGFALLLFMYAMRFMKWNYYSFKTIQELALVIAYFAFTAWQYILIFVSTEKPNLAAISAFFLTQDLYIVFLYILLVQSMYQYDMQTILKKYVLPVKREHLDPDRPTNLAEEVKTQEADKEWFVSQADIDDLCSLNNISKNRLDQIFNNQMLLTFRSQAKTVQHIVIVLLIVLNLLVLIVYAMTLNSYMGSKIGTVYASTIFAYDIVILWLAFSGIVKRQSLLLVMAFLNRYCMFLTGEQRWIYGYILVYFCIALYLSMKIVQNMVPYTFKLKKSETIDLKEPSQKFWQKVFKKPITILIFCTLLIYSMLTIMKLVKIKNVTMAFIPFLNGKTLNIIETFMFSIMVVLICFFAYSLYRSIRQRLMRFPTREYYFGTIAITYYKTLYILNFFMHIILAVFCGWLFDSGLVRECIWMGSATLLILMDGIISYIKNDFQAFQSVKRLNAQIKANNEKLQLISVEAVKFRTKVLDGDITDLPFNTLELAQTLIKNNEQPAEDILKKQETLTSANKTLHKDFKIKSYSFSIGYRRHVDQDGIEQDRQDKIDIESGGKDDEEDVKCNIKDEILHHDWREDGISPCRAFWTRKARSRDYRVIVFIFLAHIFAIILSLFFVIHLKSAVFFPIVFLPIVHFIWCFLSLLSNALTGKDMTLKDNIILVASYVSYYVGGLIIFDIQYDSSKIGVKGEGDADTAFFFIYGIIIPLISTMIASLLKSLDDVNSWKLSKQFLVLTILFLLNLVACVICTFKLYSIWRGVSLTIFIFLVVYVIWQFLAMKKNNFRISKFFTYMNIGVFIVLQVTLVIFTSYFENFSSAESLSICMGIMFLQLFTVSTLFGWIDELAEFTSPVAYSPYLYPVYQLNPKKQQLEDHHLVSGTTLGALCVAFALSFTITIMVIPYDLGAIMTCFVNSLICIRFVGLTKKGMSDLTEVKDFVDEKIVKAAWLDAKQIYCSHRDLDKRIGLITFSEWTMRRYEVESFLATWGGRDKLAAPQIDEFKQVHEEATQSADTHSYFQDKIDLWINDEIHNCNNYLEMSAFLYEIDREVYSQFIQELSLIMKFQLYILIRSKTSRRTFIKYLMKFITAKKVDLFVFGIDIQVPKAGSTEAKFLSIRQSLKELTDDQTKMFKAMRDDYQICQKAKDDELERLAAAEEAANEERQRLKKEANKQRSEMLKNVDLTQPLVKIPDCKEKYKKIIEDIKASGDGQFTDEQFSHLDEQKTMGDKVFNEKEKRTIAGWKRISEIEGAVVYQDDASYQDIVQGALGDCYFLSAISVLGDQRIKDVIVDYDQKIGVYMVKLFNEGSEQLVIVDDYIVVNEAGAPCFTKGGPDGLEMWPAIIEKAYAKFYGSFANIEAGKIQMALSDMTNGFPEMQTLKKYQENPSGFWEILKHLKSIDALMGAGTPEGSDSSTTPEGIVQGHAYAVLDCVDYNGDKLIQLRNPHGRKRTTAEWNGDWGDNDSKWNQKAINKIGYIPDKSGPDGVFWMNIEDFVWEFKYLYICRLLEEKNGWKKANLQGEWKGKSSGGMPGKLQNNPQFKIKLSKPCKGFVQLRQHEEISTFKGKNQIMWLIADEDGDAITKINRETIVGKSAMVNFNQVTGEIDFSKHFSYPGTFTLMAGSRTAGPEGEGTFDITVYAQDEKMQMVPMGKKFK